MDPLRLACVAAPKRDWIEVAAAAPVSSIGNGPTMFIRTPPSLGEGSVYLNREQALSLRDHIDMLFSGPLTQAVIAAEKKTK